MEIIRVSILRVEDFLIASPQTALHDIQAIDLKDMLLQRSYESKAKAVILDLPAIDVLAGIVAPLINAISQLSKLTALNLEEGVAALRRVTELAAHGRG